jgi:hypothetical protein
VLPHQWLKKTIPGGPLFFLDWSPCVPVRRLVKSHEPGAGGEGKISLRKIMTMVKRTSLTLVPTTFSRLVVSVEKETNAIVLVRQARLQRRESVKLATEEDFNEMVGVLRLIEQVGEEPENDKPIGWMSYVGEFHDDLSHEKACYQLDVKIPRRRFNALWWQ